MTTPKAFTVFLGLLAFLSIFILTTPAKSQDPIGILWVCEKKEQAVAVMEMDQKVHINREMVNMAGCMVFPAPIGVIVISQFDKYKDSDGRPSTIVSIHPIGKPHIIGYTILLDKHISTGI